MATIDANMKQLQHADQLSMGWTVTYKGSTLVMLVNANFDQAIDFKTGLNLDAAQVLVDDDEASPSGVTKVSGMSVNGQTVTVEPLTAVMLKLK